MGLGSWVLGFGVSGFRAWVFGDFLGSRLGTQKAHKHKHFIGISLPYWASF